MSRLTVTRKVFMPDPLRIARCQRSPETGPRILFFSGGTALKGVSQKLVQFTHHSIHLITPFDSGGSSAVIRQAFQMLSVGDLRNRIMALADQSLHGNPDIYNLFATRLPMDVSSDRLADRLMNMAAGRNPLVSRIPNPMRRIIRNHIYYFIEKMPRNFDLRGASIGNLVLTGGYLNNRWHIEPVLFMFSRLINARGTVMPTTGQNYHLGARLKNGRVVLGQHRITHKTEPIDSPVTEMFLTSSLESETPVELSVPHRICDQIASADLICFPMGSFYTSVLANLLLKGIGTAIRDNCCPKVFIPNPFPDSEQLGLSLFDTVQTLVRYGERSCGEPVKPTDIVQYLLLDTRSAQYKKPLNLKKLRDMGIQIVDLPLVTPESSPHFDDQRIIEALLSLT